MSAPTICSLLLCALVCLAFVEGTQFTENSGIHHFKVGKLNGTVIFDGSLLFDQPEGIFNVPTAAVMRSYRQNFRTTTPITASQNMLLISTPHGKVIVDTGTFNVPELLTDNAGRLIPKLKEAGVSPSDIRYVILTHAHADHVSGIIKKNGDAAFPNAQVLISKVDHDFWYTPPIPYPSAIVPNQMVELLSAVYRRSVAPYLKRLTLVPENGTPLPGIRFISTPGHSKGHSAIEFDGGNGEMLTVTGDTWGSKPDLVQNPEWSFFIENDPVQAYRSRANLMNHLATARTLVLSFHEPFPGLGYIVRRGPSFDWVCSPEESL